MGGKITENFALAKHGLLREGRKETRGWEGRGLPYPVHPLLNKVGEPFTENGDDGSTL